MVVRYNTEEYNKAMRARYGGNRGLSGLATKPTVQGPKAKKAAVFEEPTVNLTPQQMLDSISKQGDASGYDLLNVLNLISQTPTATNREPAPEPMANRGASIYSDYANQGGGLGNVDVSSLAQEYNQSTNPLLNASNIFAGNQPSPVSNLPSMSNINTQINSVLDSIANNQSTVGTTNVGTGTGVGITNTNPLLGASDVFQEEINNQQISTTPGTQVIAPTKVDTIAPYTGYSQYYSQDQAGQTTGNVGGSTLGGMTVNHYTGFMQSSSNYFGAPFTQQSYTPYQSPMGYQGSGAMNQFTSPAQTYTNTVTDPNAMPEYQRQMIMQNDYQNPTGSISFGQGPRLNNPLEGYNYTSYGNMNPVFNPAATSPTSSYVSPTTQESAQTATTGGTGFSGFGNFRG